MYNPLFKEVTDGYGTMGDVIRIGVVFEEVYDPEGIRQKLLTIPRVTEVEYFENGVEVSHENDEIKHSPMFVITGEKVNYSLFMFQIEMELPNIRLAPSNVEHIYYVLQ